MNSRQIGLCLLAGLVVLAGCSGTQPPVADSDGGTGTVDLYLSDKPGALDEFETLNVTVTHVGLQPMPENNTTAATANWTEYDINDTTVDLTRLTGQNATLLDSIAVPNGSYERVFIYVSAVNGTTADGQRQRVKLPSGKLQLNSQFTVGANESVEFVFDIKVIKAGQSGKYILRPVISESGTDQPIKEVDARVRNASER